MCNHGIKIAWLLILPPSPKRGGGQRAGARENRGRERAGTGSRNIEGDSLLFIAEYYSIKNTYLAKFWYFHLTSPVFKRKFWKQEICTRAGKTALLPVNLEIPSIRLRHRSWDSMTHDTCTRLVSCSCRKSPAKKAIQVHTGQMTSKTTLIGLSISRCGNEKSVHGRPLGARSVPVYIPNYWRFCLLVQT